MAWYMVDDKFHSHPKVKSIPREVRAEAIGTWTLCGAYSADHMLDGFVPGYMVDDLGGTQAGVQALVDVGLWKTEKRRQGYKVVNWSQWQKTREQIEQKRAEDAERKRKARSAKGGGGKPPGGGVRADDDGTPAPPSHPIPSQPSHNDEGSSSSALRGDDEDRGAVDKSGEAVDAERIRQVLAALAPGHDVAWSMASACIATILDRAPTPPRMPTRYVVGAINRDAEAWRHFVITGRLAAAS